MHCGFDRELTGLYADGVLQPELVQRVESHITGCRDCREELAATRMLGEAIHSLPRERATQALIDRVFAEAVESRPQTVWHTLGSTVAEIVKAARQGCRIEEDREEKLRRELPAWVLRWVLYI